MHVSLSQISEMAYLLSTSIDLCCIFEPTCILAVGGCFPTLPSPPFSPAYHQPSMQVESLLILHTFVCAFDKLLMFDGW